MVDPKKALVKGVVHIGAPLHAYGLSVSHGLDAIVAIGSGEEQAKCLGESEKGLTCGNAGGMQVIALKAELIHVAALLDRLFAGHPVSLLLFVMICCPLIMNLFQVRCFSLTRNLLQFSDN